jgi:type VI secretion system secreted protein VgrG
MGFPDLPGQAALADAVQDTLASFASPFSQYDRLFTLRFAADSGIAPDLLLPHRLRGLERVSGTYLYQVELLSANVYIEAKDILGQPAEIALLLADGNERLITGIVTAFGPIAADGGMARYVLHLEPCLAVLAHRFNACVRQDMTVQQVLQDVFDRHLQQNPVVQRAFHVEFRLTATYPTLSYCNQYESDLHFVERLMAEHGMFYFFEFSRDNGYPVHTLIIGDDPHTFAEGTQPTVRFAGARAVEEEDTLVQWSGLRQIQPGLVRLTSFDYKTVATDHVHTDSRIDQGEAGNALASTLEDFDPRGHYYASGGDTLERHAQIRQEAHDFLSKQFQGVSSVRAAAAGTRFELSGHDVHDQDYSEQRQFVIVSLVCEAENNFLQHSDTALGRLMAAQPEVPVALAPWFGHGQHLLEEGQSPYRNVLTCVRHGVPIRPRYAHTDYAKPTAPGPMTATVVGPAGAEIYTDEMGRIKIQYDWQLPQQHPDGTAAGNEKSSAWVRVAYPSAGADWGTQYIPRVGQEVAIQFLHGDLDRPVCVGVLHNGTHRPPTFSSTGGLPANRALSGTKTKEVGGQQYNELLFDDTTGEVRAKLSSEHAKTQLNLGYLIHPRTDGKGEPRGEGFELRTDAAGAIRAAKALLLSTEPQEQARGKQLSRETLLSVLDAALTMVEQLGEAARTQHANLPETGKDNQLIQDDAVPGATKQTGHQAQLKQALDNLERSSNTDKNGKTGHGDQPGGQHVMALTAPDGLALTTMASATIATGTNLDQVAMRDTNQTTGRRWIHNVTESISLFVLGAKARIKDTFKLIAAKGNIQMQAQDGEIQATAQHDFTISSVDGKVVISAPKEVLITAGGGYIRVGANIEIHNPGKQSQKAASFALSGPTSMSAAAQNFPRSEVKFDDDYILRNHINGKPVANRKFKLIREDGNVITGTTDGQGRTGLQKSLFSEKIQLILGKVE